MMKHAPSLGILFAFAIFLPLTPQIYLPPELSKDMLLKLLKEKTNSNDVEFAFDLHETLLQPDTYAQWRYAMEFPKKWDLASNILNLQLMNEVGYYGWHALLSLIPFLQESIFVEEVSGERFLSLFKQLEQNTLAEFVTTMINKQCVNLEMKNIVIELKKQGYPVRIASNIGKTIYDELKQQFKEQEENLFDLFDRDDNGLEGKVVDYCDRGRAKPNKSYYEEYLATYDPDNTKLFIFVDDKKRNVLAAACHGFIAIHFTTARELINDLQEIGIEIMQTKQSA